MKIDKEQNGLILAAGIAFILNLLLILNFGLQLTLEENITLYSLLLGFKSEWSVIVLLAITSYLTAWKFYNKQWTRVKVGRQRGITSLLIVLFLPIMEVLFILLLMTFFVVLYLLATIFAFVFSDTLKTWMLLLDFSVSLFIYIYVLYLIGKMKSWLQWRKDKRYTKDEVIAVELEHVFLLQLEDNEMDENYLKKSERFEFKPSAFQEVKAYNHLLREWKESNGSAEVKAKLIQQQQEWLKESNAGRL